MTSKQFDSHSRGKLIFYKNYVFALLTYLAGAVIISYGPTAFADAGISASTARPVSRELNTTAVAPEPTTQTVHYADSLLDTIGYEFYLPNSENQRTTQQLNWYLKNPEYLNRVFERSRRYLPFIVAEIRKRGMPMEIALLPVVESAYDPFAYSHGRAAGLWQFIPGTGKMFGLTQDWWYDGRRDPVASTIAALDYLQHLHERLGGDWLLAIAAYNSGEGRVRGAVRKNRKKNLPTDFWNLKLPRETRAYVPKLLAISHLVKNSQQLHVYLPRVPSQPYFREVKTGGQIDLALVADLAGLDVQEIYRLNSGFNRWATSPKGPHRLMVPVEVSYALENKLAELPAESRIKWRRHKIKSGDSLSTIAQKFRTTVGTLKSANQIKGTSIRAGKYLLIPEATRDLSNYGLSQDMREHRIVARAEKSNTKKYRVKSGDSFWSIGRQFGVGTRQLARWNGMAPGDTLSVGKTLVIKGVSETVANNPATSTSPDGTRRKIHYTVRSGDSLARISSRFRVSVGQLRQWNNLNGQKYLQPGQKLKLYVDVTKQSGG